MKYYAFIFAALLTLPLIAAEVDVEQGIVFNTSSSNTSILFNCADSSIGEATINGDDISIIDYYVGGLLVYASQSFNTPNTLTMLPCTSTPTYNFDIVTLLPTPEYTNSNPWMYCNWTSPNQIKNATYNLHVNDGTGWKLNKTLITNTSFLLKFNGNNLTEDYEAPINGNNYNYITGVDGQGLNLTQSTGKAPSVNYTSVGNFNPEKGTISFWINVTNTTDMFPVNGNVNKIVRIFNNSAVLATAMGCSITSALIPPLNYYNLTCTVNDGQTISLVQKGFMDWGKFYHVQLTYNKDDNITLYVNGEIVGSKTGLGVAVYNANAITIGFTATFPFPQPQYVIDNFEIIGYEKQPEQIAWEYAHPKEEYTFDAPFNVTSFIANTHLIAECCGYDNTGDIDCKNSSISTVVAKPSVSMGNYIVRRLNLYGAGVSIPGTHPLGRRRIGEVVGA